jgi:hypothetical protein
MPFSAMFRKVGQAGWAAQRAFKRTEHDSDAKYDAQSLQGVCVDVLYSGCPHCGDKRFFVCPRCAALNCLGSAVKTSDGAVVTCCGCCDLSGVVQGVITELKGSREE